MTTTLQDPPPIQEPSTTHAPGLPSPADRPAADVVIYDGHCRMCSAQVRRLHRWDSGRRLAYLSLHDPKVRQLYPNLSHEVLMQQLHVVAPSGRIYRGAEAVRYLTRRLRSLWWLAPAMHVPCSLPLWARLYQYVAERRYRFNRVVPGGGETCENGTCDLHRHAPHSESGKNR